MYEWNGFILSADVGHLANIPLLPGVLPILWQKISKTKERNNNRFFHPGMPGAWRYAAVVLQAASHFTGKFTELAMKHR